VQTPIARRRGAWLARSPNASARELGVPLVGDKHRFIFCDPRNTCHHRVVKRDPQGRITYHRRLSDPEITTGEAMFKPSGRNAKMLPRSSGMAASNPGDCERCNFAPLELGKLIIPEFTVPEGETPDSYLQKLSLKGALKRYHSLNTRSAFAS